MTNPFESIESRLNSIENLLLDLKHAPSETATPASNTNDLMTVHQTAEFLSLAVPSIYSMVSRGVLPYMKRSKRIYFSRAELMEYLKAGRHHTNAEVMANANQLINKRNRRKQ